MGTQQSGLKMADFSAFPNFGDWLIFNENEDQRKLQNNRISQIKEDSQGRIWLGTYSGLNRFEESTQQFLSHGDLVGDKLDINIINDLLIEGSQMYLATPIGLAAVIMEGEQLIFQDFYEKSRGMVNDFVCAIEQDQAGNLWLSTTTTVTKFNPKTKNFINFDREDGILINSFHTGSSFQGQSGEIYFGGSNGLVSFFPDQIKEVFNVPEVVLTKLTVNNQVLHVGDEVDGSVILETSIQNTSKINLDYSQNHLSLNFAVNDFFWTG
ncbi:two-component regulator propeller domain-containing protein [Algoriphagus boritolerans]|uniref:two-component regulator propeller domain-containing protein n=1 Tax=Algoriphagus boritolerans TaxID=308111 RepID=UPI000A91C9E3